MKLSARTAIFGLALVLATPAFALSLFEMSAGPTLTGAGTVAASRVGAYLGPGVAAAMWFGKNCGAGLEGGYLTGPEAWQARGEVYGGYWRFSLGGTLSGTFAADRASVLAAGPEVAFHLPLPLSWYADDSRREDSVSVFVRYDVPLSSDPEDMARRVSVGLKFLLDLFADEAP
jgi:hypothetical protein